MWTSSKRPLTICRTSSGASKRLRMTSTIVLSDLLDVVRGRSDTPGDGFGELCRVGLGAHQRQVEARQVRLLGLASNVLPSGWQAANESLRVADLESDHS